MKRSFQPIVPVIHTLVLAGLTAGAAGQDSLGAFVRMRGQQDSVVQGLGLVIGLNGTGDSGADLVLARPLAEALRRLGNPVADFAELRNSRSAALVMVTCTIPPMGAAVGDVYDVRVATLHSATSLLGGQLIISPLLSSNPEDPLIYAYGEGALRLEDPEHPTVAIVAGGGRVAVDIATTAAIGDVFDLIVQPAYVGWPAVNYLSNQIEDEYYLTVAPNAEPVAVVVNERTIRVIVPEAERANPAAFVGQVMQTPVTASLLGLPAKVVANTRTGVIVVDGEVEISPAVITHKSLVISTTLPTPEPTPEAPIVERGRWARVAPGAEPPALGRIQDLLASLNQLDVPPADQIEILLLMHEAGKLHGRLIVDGVEQ